jgi:hypothetical protein
MHVFGFMFRVQQEGMLFWVQEGPALSDARSLALEPCLGAQLLLLLVIEVIVAAGSSSEGWGLISRATRHCCVRLDLCACMWRCWFDLALPCAGCLC